MFSAEERAIFEYFDGEKQRKADPIELIRAMHSIDGFDPQADAKAADVGDMQAMGRVIDAARKVFGVSSFSEENGETKGLLSFEVLQLVKSLGDFLRDLQKKTKNLAMSQDATESTPAK